MSTKPRKLASIEKGLTEIAKVLNEEEIKSQANGLAEILRSMT